MKTTHHRDTESTEKTELGFGFLCALCITHYRFLVAITQFLCSECEYLHIGIVDVADGRGEESAAIGDFVAVALGDLADQSVGAESLQLPRHASALAFRLDRVGRG